jgi:hypothetical protein
MSAVQNTVGSRRFVIALAAAGGVFAVQSVGWAFQSVLQTFLTATPVVLLVAVLLWIRLRQQPASGAADQV